MIARIPGMPLLLALTLVGFSGFSLLLPLSPLWAIEGGADALGAGLVTTIFMAVTVLAQLNVNRLLARLGWGRTLGLGLALLGLPSLAQALSPELWLVLTTTAVRGVGFGIITVCGSTGTSILAPPHVRGRAIGVFGLAIAVPQVALMSTGPAIAHAIGLQATIALGVAPIIGLAWVAPLGRIIERHEHLGGEPTSTASASLTPSPAPRGAASPSPSPASSAWAHLRRVLLPVTALVLATATGGSVLTFAPQFAVTTATATWMLLGVTVLTALSRWLFGQLADRFGTRPFLWSLMAVAGVGVGIIAAGAMQGGAAASPMLIAGACVLGSAYGGLQTVTLVRAFADGGEAERARSSVVWNIGFDVGTGTGAMAVGAIALSASFGAAFATLAAVCALAAIAIGATELCGRASSSERGGAP